MSEVRAAMRLGAYDYIFKDELSEEMVLPILQGLHSTRALEREVQRLRARQRGAGGSTLIGTSAAMQRLRDALLRVSVSDRPVLVSGPTGSGKELVVRELHALGREPAAPLLDLNCSAFPRELIESQLFGHERGAFTGAGQKHDGFFTAVGNGTLFLDEIAELPLELQAKLLRVLETGTYRPLGTASTREFSGRVVAATHADLEQRVAEHKFREDLYYRLNVLELRVPALHERPEDIPALVAHFSARLTQPLHFTAGAIETLQAARWPGNVRQLRNLIDRLAVFYGEASITAELIATTLDGRREAEPITRQLQELARAVLHGPGTDKLQRMERVLVAEALRMSANNKTIAARLLGVHRKVVARRSSTPDGEDDEADTG
jgi:DNA-binding NtrC family response regulator